MPMVTSRRALVLAYNKRGPGDRRELLQREIDRELVQVRWAQTGQHLRQDAGRCNAGAGHGGCAGADTGSRPAR